MLSWFTQGAPPKPSKEVDQLIQSLNLSIRDVHVMYRVYQKLESRSKTDKDVHVSTLPTLVNDKREFVSDILTSIVELSGCFDVIKWDQFLYTFLRFCSMSKIELAQLQFFVIIKDMKSWTVHYLTASQLEEYYKKFRNSEVESFSTSDIRFARLPLARYYISDFVELCFRYAALVNPIIHLQRCIQKKLPGLRFWDNIDRQTSGDQQGNRKITLEFFLAKKTHMFLQSSAQAFRETCDVLLPETLGGVLTEEAANLTGDRPKQLRASEQIKATFGQGSAASGKRQMGTAEPDILEKGDLTGARLKHVPAWMRQYVAVNDKRSYAERALEIDFLARSRDRKPEPLNVVLAVEEKHQGKLMERKTQAETDN